MEFQIIWFILWGLLWAVYFALDGFDFGAGILYPFISKNEMDKKAVIHAIGPVWNGNEVWLITAGGATFAAFPTTYAYMFSYLYTPLLIILFALILRGVAVEFRPKAVTDTQKKLWDIGIFLGSLIPSFLFGVAFGNIFMGLKFDDSGYYGTLFSLLNPYGLLVGLLFLFTFIVHGGLWISLKVQDTLAEKAMARAKKFWYVQAICAVLFLILTAVFTNLYDNFLKLPFWFAVPALAVICLLVTGFYIMKNKRGRAFISSALFIISLVFSGVIGLYPNLIPSSIDSKYSLTLFNSSSSPYTLKIMTIVIIIFVPIVLFYQAWTYKTFMYKITEKELKEESY
ncbi:cytochrome d ubiquinol oxidase subunit II [Thermodesulfovibrio yellowstonii]|uniref:Cytochrome D ubiquinol oxidase subunit II n=1 Tax=Thermodesulfovibrio yellowstonii TaxID=28262 RepID=A0A9W6GG62_9BACT|nr:MULTISPECIES: cytochrome d ubiquinol oxidase subunit II [Thermodesulfovibrio]MDI6864926.1 cytochrome d ubiquinol oxidase subunit II [Thermodesulfovibrio yellowstonii]GLI53291.1 cytochrome D ubiquinol oxidase subunit II [Thermodesulfovibrio islandicus]